MENISLIVLLVLLVVIGRELRAGNRAVTADPSIELKPSERFRTLRMQMLEPVLAVVVVGSLLLTDLERAPAHAAVALVGVIAGCGFGAYRARVTYVAAVPAHKGVILRHSLESFVALGLLIVIKVVAEQDLLPEGAVFGLVLAALLGFLLAESCARVFTLTRFYRLEESKAVVTV